jgi:hypothetical protein
MASTKKDKGASAPETRECDNCKAPEDRNGVTLKPCPKCKLTSYCGRACQASHWKAGHKQFCVAPGERKPQPVSTPARLKGCQTIITHAEEATVECAICLDPLSSSTPCTLPCTHTFHASCVKGLRSFGIKQVCPMCRVELPPGPDKLSEEPTRRYCGVKRRVGCGKAPWGALTKAQQKGLRRRYNSTTQIQHTAWKPSTSLQKNPQLDT